MATNKTKEYSKYLTDHIDCVQKGFNWLRSYLPELFTNESVDIYDLEDQIFSHDEPKYMDEEWDAYEEYFYGEKTKEVKDNFNYAWLHHIHNCPHHWQHWVLINDDEDTVALDMPYNYIIEMICDWWAFSWKGSNLFEIFDWYDSHKDKMMLSDETQKTVEDILSKLKDKLEEFGLK